MVTSPRFDGFSSFHEKTNNLKKSGNENIRCLILEKEKELHDINEYRIRTLETLLKEKVVDLLRLRDLYEIIGRV